jgi:DNA-binding protein HU-beta
MKGWLIKMNKTELIAAVAEHAEVTKATAEKVLNSLFTVVPADLAAHKEEENYKVQIMGFGTFKASFVAGRMGVNPKNRDEEVEIPDSFRIHFSAGQNFKDVVNDVEKDAPAKKAPAKKGKASAKKAPAKATKAPAKTAPAKGKKKKK